MKEMCFNCREEVLYIAENYHKKDDFFEDYPKNIKLCGHLSKQDSGDQKYCVAEFREFLIRLDPSQGTFSL